AFRPETLPLHPTQVYESITAILLFCLLLAYLPFRRHDGELLALLMCLYPIHRFLDEILRNDTDPVAFGMTLSQNVSIVCIIGGVVFFWWLRRQPAQYQPETATSPALVTR
ncbi:MAG TPA: prolipoprotein diacylglyceryl transferase family protein, partial [Gemmataceae bacterium]|nr:prolipoprotein diacylglyceryl transferase family protein [Gemmataceae bacterium]